MAMGGPRPMLWLPLVLLAAGLAQPSEGASYRQFLRQHVDFPKARAPNARIYCNTLMQSRGMTQHFCKSNNTFIHAPATQLQAICRGAGIWHAQNLFDSNVAYPLTMCERQPGSRPGRCNYRASTFTRRIRVGCDRRQRLPVHFDDIL